MRRGDERGDERRLEHRAPSAWGDASRRRACVEEERGACGRTQQHTTNEKTVHSSSRDRLFSNSAHAAAVGLFVCLVEMGRLRIGWARAVRICQKRTDRDENGADRVDGGPVVLDQVHAEGAVRVDVRVELRERTHTQGRTSPASEGKQGAACSMRRRQPQRDSVDTSRSTRHAARVQSKRERASGGQLLCHGVASAAASGCHSDFFRATSAHHLGCEAHARRLVRVLLWEG